MNKQHLFWLSLSKNFVQRKKYEILLASLMMLIFCDTLEFTTIGKHFHKFLPLINMLVGFTVFFSNKALRKLIIVLMSVSVFCIICKNYTTFSIPHADWHSLTGITYVVYFVFISIQVYRNILRTEKVSLEMISALLCGFVLLGLLSTFLFNQIEVMHSHSFSNLGVGESNQMNDLNYFSFVTILSIGYGDILPLTLVAKRAVMLVGLISYFYTAFVTGIVIGKYINYSAKNTAHETN